MFRKLTKNLRKILFLLTVLVFLLTGFFFFRSEALFIKNIVVTTDYNVTANPQIVKILEKTKKQNFFLLKTEEVAEQIKSQDLKIDEVKIEKVFPGKLLVTIQARQPLASLKTQDGYFLVDEQGLIFDQQNEPGSYPSLNLGLQNPQIGSTIDKREEIALKILVFLKGKEEVLFITKEADYYFLQLTEGLSIIFPEKDETQKKLDSLQMILTRFKIEGKRPVKIDLRFDKPVISF